MDPDDAGGGTAAFLAVAFLAVAFLVAFHWIQMMQAVELLSFLLSCWIRWRSPSIGSG